MENKFKVGDKIIHALNRSKGVVLGTKNEPYRGVLLMEVPKGYDYIVGLEHSIIEFGGNIVPVEERNIWLQNEG